MRIGELAKRAAVNTSKIRFYEAKGLLPLATRLPNGYRDYSDHDLEVVKFIDRAQSLGFTLREVVAHLGSPQGDARKARLQARLQEKLAELDALLDQMHARRAVLLNLIDEIRVARVIA
jgi:MerR family copper efflux transcriptional regulator